MITALFCCLLLPVCLQSQTFVDHHQLGPAADITVPGGCHELLFQPHASEQALKATVEWITDLY